MDEKKPHGLSDQMAHPTGYVPSTPMSMPPESSKESEKLRTELDDFKKKVMKKFPSTLSLSVLPTASFAAFEEEEAFTKEESARKPIHLYWVVPEDEYQHITKKLKPEMIKLVQESKQNVWVHIKTPVDVWNYGLDSKFDLIDAVAASYPLFDKGFLGALRVANIHKTLVLRKFEKYVATYAVGGSLVRGTAGKDSDVDTFVVIDDTDVKKMPRMQLLERLRGYIYDYIREANALAGVKNVLNVQVYLLTDFWQSVKDATPVIFTFIRDGIPMHDRGTFLPWKMLLKMGKIKPSPEAVDTFMKYGEQNDGLVKRRLMDALVDIYWGVVTPTQALAMLAGEGPEAPKHLVSQIKRLFVEKEKIMGAKELKTLEKVVGLYKDYEHGALKEISGAEIDQLLKDANNYDKALKVMRTKLERRIVEQTADSLLEETIALLKNTFGEHGKDDLVKRFEKELIKSGKLPQRLGPVIKAVFELKQKSRQKTFTQHDLDAVRRDADELITKLVEYQQRKDIAKAERGIVRAQVKHGLIEIVLTGAGTFIVDRGVVSRVDHEKLVSATGDQLDKALKETKERETLRLNEETFSALRKHYGSLEFVF